MSAFTPISMTPWKCRSSWRQSRVLPVAGLGPKYLSRRFATGSDKMLAGLAVARARRSCRFTSVDDAVILVFDRQRGAPAQPDVTHRFVPRWQPEALYFCVFVMDLALLRPKGRILRRLGFDANHREIGSIDPDLAAIHVFARSLRADLQHVPRTTRIRGFVPDERKIIVAAIQGRPLAHGGLCRFLLAFHQFSEYAIPNQLRSTLGNDLERLGGGGIELRFHRHLRFAFAREATIDEVIHPRRLRMPQRLRPFFVSADQGIHDPIDGEWRGCDGRRQRFRVRMDCTGARRQRTRREECHPT